MKTNKQKKNRLHYAITVVVSIALILMGIGVWAYLEFFPSSLNSEQQNSKHTVGLDAKSYLESEDSILASSTKISLDRMDISLRLPRPGDRYATLINIVNDDNKDHYIHGIELSGLKNYANIVDFEVEIEGETYKKTTKNLNIYLPSGGQETRRQIYVKVKYRDGAQNLGAANLDLSVKLDF